MMLGTEPASAIPSPLTRLRGPVLIGVLIASTAAMLAAFALSAGAARDLVPLCYLAVMLPAALANPPLTLIAGSAGAVITVLANVNGALVHAVALAVLGVGATLYASMARAERRRLDEAILQREALLDASRILSATDELAAAVTSALELLPRILPDFRCAAIYLEGEADGLLRLHDVVGLKAEQLAMPQFHPERDDVGWKPSDVFPLYVRDARGLPSCRIAQLDPDAASAICVGLQAARALTRSIGMLYVSSSRTAGFSLDQVAALEQFGDLIGFPLAKIRAQEGLISMAYTDSLTGLPNQRAFQIRLDDEIARAARYRRRFALLILDLDDFKRINDRYGHAAGDAALRAVAEVLRSGLRESDFVARYGGEEFAVICGEGSGEEALCVAERLRAAVSARPLNCGDDVLSLSLSIGLAAYPQHASDARALFHAADLALYQAKRSGKNRTEAASAAPVSETRIA